MCTILEFEPAIIGIRSLRLPHRRPPAGKVKCVLKRGFGGFKRFFWEHSGASFLKMRRTA